MTETATTSPGERRLERAAAKQRRNRRNALIAAVSSVVVIGGLAALILTSPGWPTVRETFFSWAEFKNSFPEVLSGFWLDVKIFVVVEIAVLILGLAVALVRNRLTPAYQARVAVLAEPCTPATPAPWRTAKPRPNV